MDILSLITQTNAVSILFFCITAILVTYEFVLFLREKKKKVRPVIPGFSASKSSPVAASKPSNHAPPALKKQHISPRKNVVAGIAGLVILATTGLIVYITIQNNNKSALPPIGSHAQSDTTQELINVATDTAMLNQTATDSASATATQSVVQSNTQTTATNSATMADSQAEASDAANLISSNEAQLITLDDTDLNDTATLAAATVSEPSPTPITQLPLTSTYQYFFTAIAAASAILVASLVF